MECDSARARLVKLAPSQITETTEFSELSNISCTVIAAARRSVEDEEPELHFEHMRNGYRLFDPKRGMDYMVDLVYKSDCDEDIERRVHLSRMIASTQMLDHNTRFFLVVGFLLDMLCNSTVDEARKTRVVIALSPLIDPRSAAAFSNDLEGLRKICHRSRIETDFITVHSHEPGTGSSPESAALDESIDRYMEPTLFSLSSRRMPTSSENSWIEPELTPSRNIRCFPGAVCGVPSDDFSNGRLRE